MPVPDIEQETTCSALTTHDEPVGGGEYEVQQGDCVESIASRSGHFWKTIWSDPANEPVKSARKNPNVLLPGDRLHIPPLRRADVTCATDQSHKFVRHGVPSMLCVRVLEGGQPRANEHYILTVDGQVSEGTTGDKGDVEVAIPPHAASARLVVGEGLHQYVYQLDLGGMDPIETLAGLRKRLQNLSYCGPAEDGQQDGIGAALTMFQKNNGLETTGELDDATRAMLLQKHGS